MTFVTKPPVARLFLPGAALRMCPVMTPAAGRAQEETAETYTDPLSKDFADAFVDPSIVKARDGYRCHHGTGESPRGREGSTRFDPMAPALQI